MGCMDGENPIPDADGHRETERQHGSDHDPKDGNATSVVHYGSE